MRCVHLNHLKRFGICLGWKGVPGTSVVIVYGEQNAKEKDLAYIKKWKKEIRAELLDRTERQRKSLWGFDS